MLTFSKGCQSSWSEEMLLSSSIGFPPSWALYYNYPLTDFKVFELMASFVERVGLVPLWSTHQVPYTHVHTDGKSRSTVDHFLLSPHLLDLVEKCGVVERGDNLSRHCPIWVKIKLGALPLRSGAKTWVPKRPSWSKATTEEVNAYTIDLQSRLMSLQLPDSAIKFTAKTEIVWSWTYLTQ